MAVALLDIAMTFSHKWPPTCNQMEPVLELIYANIQ